MESKLRKGMHPDVPLLATIALIVWTFVLPLLLLGGA
jgi:hypothetical protein